MKRILLLTDFSGAASNAIQYALKFWSGFICEFYLMHIKDSKDFITDDFITQKTSVSIYDTLVKDSKHKLKVLEKELQGQCAQEQCTFTSKVDVDDFTDAINQVVQLHQIDQVVIGSNGVSNIKEVLFGSHALMVIRSVSCNVLVVPADYTFETSESILFLLEETDELNPSILNQLQFLAKKAQWNVDIIRFWKSTPNQKVTEADGILIKTISKNVKLTYKTIQGVTLLAAVDTLIQTRKIGLLVMLGNFKSFLSRLRSRSHKSQIGKLGKIPILSLKV